ncbi:uncharacterized protein LOC126993056 isoform X1 [Eriocheir sinensis]|uniref:uncharacterized protein LOC126993056 isoform X1 n=2 Tax=Eriocheir sinensis TaxID=95602 RepID=UPI0021C9F8DF|nr:uncharacterized protein LOC126993056 isoform X1 [Eriocheir sinensis]
MCPRCFSDVSCDLVTNLGETHTSPAQQSPFSDDSSGYHWDDYDMHGPHTLVGCGSEGATAAPPDLLMLSQGTSLFHGVDPMEGTPLLLCSAATPLLSVDARGGPDGRDTPDGDEDNDDPCSFEEILLANNISVDSCQDLTLDHSSKYNIVSDLEDDCPESALKISNMPSVVDDANRLGSPRSRRPFHCRDYSCVSDLSFLSALEEEGVDDSMSELQESDYELLDRVSEPLTPTLVQTSLSEVFL